MMSSAGRAAAAGCTPRPGGRRRERRVRQRLAVDGANVKQIRQDHRHQDTGEPNAVARSHQPGAGQAIRGDSERIAKGGMHHADPLPDTTWACGELSLARLADGSQI